MLKFPFYDLFFVSSFSWSVLTQMLSLPLKPSYHFVSASVGLHITLLSLVALCRSSLYLYDCRTECAESQRYSLLTAVSRALPEAVRKRGYATLPTAKDFRYYRTTVWSLCALPPVESGRPALSESGRCVTWAGCVVIFRASTISIQVFF